MSDETNAVDGAIPAASVSAPEAVEQDLSAAPAEAEQGQEQERDEQGRFKPKAQERINELTRARRQAERERDALAAEVQQYRTQRQEPQAHGEKPPAFEDFQDLNQWAEAVAVHAARQAEARAEAKFSERQQQSSQEQVFEGYAKREREYAAANPGYADAYNSLQDNVRFNPAVLEVIATSDAGPAVVQFLGTHLDVADQIARMPAHMAAAQIARIEAQVKAPKAKPVSSAPAPAPKLGGGSAAPKEPDRMSVDEWMAWRQTNLKK